MVELGIPVYKARDTLPDALNSVVAQTYPKEKFFVCLSIDGDGENYDDIINYYRILGLHIRVINSEINGGPGVACQRILDTTQASHIMFLDADDMLMPRAIEVLYKHARLSDYDVLRSSFIKENLDKEDQLMSAEDNIITWRHGKIYKVQYLRDRHIFFHPHLRTDEDAYFNAVAWNSTQKLGMMNEVTYLWRANPNSITRQEKFKQYFEKTHMNYILGQVEAMKYLMIINESVPSLLITNTLMNIYYYYMRGRVYGCDEKEMDDAISMLRDEQWMQVWLRDAQNWTDIVTTIKGGQIIDDHICFFEEPFNLWAKRLLFNENLEVQAQ